jgi:hypothetical protein
MTSRTRYQMLLGAILLCGALVLWPFMRRLHAIDSCLDRGGFWDHSAHRCEPALNPSSPNANSTTVAPTRDQQRDRAAARAVARDTAAHAWRHEVDVDSVRLRGDTTVVWVSPRNWMATDAPQAGVRVMPRGRVVGVEWIMGG